MTSLILIVLVAGACGGAFGFLVLGKYRSVFTIFDGNNLLHLMFGCVWRGLLYPVGLLGPPMLFAGLVGFYPMKPIEAIAVLFASFICSSFGERSFSRHNTTAARRAGLISEEDL